MKGETEGDQRKESGGAVRILFMFMEIHVLMFVDFSLYALATHLLCITGLVLVSSYKGCYTNV